MDTLPLLPLPAENREKSGIHRPLGGEGFVDEAMVSRVIARGVYDRVFVKSEELVLSSSEDDYAGWALPVPSPFRGMREFQAPAPTPVRHPTPPVPADSETGIERPYAGGLRWWLFGTAGAMICGLLSLTLLHLAHRADVHGIAAGSMSMPIDAAAPGPSAPEPPVQPTLTRAQAGFR